ncbi:hypothetical protein O6H91_07G069700 [Diphasiastrum complanatum]|uniref:Uncharacterized protein n=1 Tax=Diphasiastrum complanatum TaxID=34168 RepID=A0ACC2D6C2_DIPCM|nr:hypothetical protein O6H91_07G069700 [Diphasiastrum complanatum]
MGEDFLRLRCKVQHYDWGRTGADSKVAQLHALMSGIPVQEGVPYAELWMGTHESGPSFVFWEGMQSGQEGVPLKDWLKEHPDALGQKVVERWGADLPYLFKVLSVAKALSIQAHPDKKLAETLHQKRPDLYKDPNHKPEMALALTPFEALCGFVTPEELKNALDTVPELTNVLDQQVFEGLITIQNSGSPEEAALSLRRAFTELMTLGKPIVAETVSNLVSRLTKEKQLRDLTEKEELVLRLETQYPGDVGILSAFFLNFIKLLPGQAVYLAANEPHAYLSGECIECMATSDNVVRAGLTPKYRDTETLCSMLTYKQGLPEILTGTPVNSFTKRYSPPFDEFEVDHIVVPSGDKVSFAAISGPSIYLVCEGVGTLTPQRSTIFGLKVGDIFFIPAGKDIEVSAITEADVSGKASSSLQLYRAGVSSKVLTNSI